MNIKDWKTTFINDVIKHIKIGLYNNRVLKNISYFVNIKEHNISGPSYNEWYADGNKKHQMCHINGIKNNFVNGNKIIPAQIWYYTNGNKEFETFYIDGKPNNCYGGKNIIPAHSEWYKNGSLMRIIYCDNGLINNLVCMDKTVIPAFTSWYNNGKKFYDRYYKNDYLIKEIRY